MNIILQVRQLAGFFVITYLTSENSVPFLFKDKGI